MYQAYLRHFSWISQAYLRHISSISQAYLRHIAGISLAYLRHMSGISQAHIRDISSVSQAYFRHISGIFHVYLKHISGISQANLRNISGYSLANLRKISSKFQAYLRLLAPSLGALQDMLRTCEEYATKHNLKFSTDPDPVKCKTKLMAFLKSPRELPGLVLCGVELPWVDRIKHLGNCITNSMEGNQYDMKVKSARYVDKCNSLSQEFHFCYPLTKVHINNIYNSHFTGSQLWGLGSKEMGKLESTYNRSVKLMFNLPLPTHRYFVEPLTEQPHLQKLLFRRYLAFISRIENSAKRPLRTLLRLSRKDLRTTTGRNLRLLMILLGKNSVDDLSVDDIDSLEYHTIPENEAWRVGLLQELIAVRENKCEITGFASEELDDILDHVCTS